MSIVLENVSHTYLPGTQQAVGALDHISLEIESRSFVGIIGQTGSGKSTLVQHFNALMLPESGTVHVDGIDVMDKKSRRELRRIVGMVFQYPEYQLFAETVEEDIAFGPKNLGTPEDERKSCVEEAMRTVGLDYERYAESSPFELSGGQKRRVALAGVIATQPRYLVLDEPMAGLDPAGRAEIIDFLKRYHQQGNTIVMVSHSMDDVADLSDHVLVMDKGSLVLSGSPEEVFAQGDRLKELHLERPRAGEMAQMLRQRGVPLPESICTMEGLLRALEGGASVQ